VAAAWTLAVPPTRCCSSPAVQSGHYERQDQLLYDFPADPTTNLAQTTNVVEASSSDFGDVFFRRQL